MRDKAASAEAMLYDYERDWVPSGLDQIERSDLLMWRRHGWPPSHSRVAYARWDESTVERGINEDPNAILFEAYDPGPDPRLKDFQWQCIRLLFERSGDRWFLVSVVHGEWTI